MSSVRRRPGIELLESRDVPALIFAVTTADHLISFDSATPGTLASDVAITGVGAGEEIEGIDFSPFGGTLFMITSASGHARLYQLNPTTGVASLRIPNTIPSSGTLAGTNFGFDINPVTGRPRLVTDTDENVTFTVNLANTTTDTALAYVSGDANDGVNPSVVGIAYNSNVSGGTNTTLFGIDSGTDSLVRIGSVGGSPDGAGSGKLTTIGSLNFNTLALVGFDIADGTASFAFSSLTGVAATRSTLTRITLATGNATSLGEIGTAAGTFVRDIAVALVGRFNITTNDTAVSESGGSVTVTVTRSIGSVVPASVSFELLNGTATTGDDFSISPVTLNFAAGETSKTFSVNLVNDALIEGTETVKLRLTNPTNNVSTDASQVLTVTILDDDFPPPPPPPPGVIPLVVRLRKRSRVDLLDPVTRVARRSLLFRNRVRVKQLDLNGDGVAEVVLQFVRNGRKRRLALDAVTLGSLPLPQTRRGS